MGSVPTVACMTTYPPRYQMALRAMKVLSRQVGHLFCYVNGSREKHQHPDWRTAPENVTVLLADQEAGNLGDVGKFYPLRYITGQAVVLTVDDDIRYPPDYVETMVENVERYDRECVVGVHGYDAPEGYVSSFYGEGQRGKVNFAHGLSQPRVVHILGTGTTAFWSETVDVSAKSFPVQNMADLFFARYCQKQEIGMVMIQRDPGWLRPYPTPDDGIWGEFKDKDETQTWLINSTEWRHHAHIKESS